MLQDIHQKLTNATEVVAEIAKRFQGGDPAEKELADLAACITGVAAYDLATLPADVRAAVERLLLSVGEALAAGGQWLEKAGPELASQQVRQRLRRAYGRT